MNFAIDGDPTIPELKFEYGRRATKNTAFQGFRCGDPIHILTITHLANFLGQSLPVYQFLVVSENHDKLLVLQIPISSLFSALSRIQVGWQPYLNIP